MSLSALNHLAFKLETTFGTGVTTDVSYPIESEDLKIEGGILESNPVMANRAGAIKALAKRKSYGGSINTFIYPGEFGHLLKALFGGYAVTTTTGVYIHTFTPSNTALPSLTIQKNSQNSTCYDFAGSRIDSMAFNFKNDEEVSVAINVVAKTAAAQTAITPSFPTNLPIVATGVSVKLAADISSLGAATAESDIQDLNLTYSNNLEAKYGLDGSQDPSRIDSKRYTISGSFNKYFSSNSELTSFLARTQKAMGIYLLGDLITGSTYQGLNFLIDDLKFTTVSIPTGVNEVMIMKCDFVGFYNTTNSSAIKAVLTTATATY